MTVAAIPKDVLGSAVRIGRISASAYTIPTDKPEADGTQSSANICSKSATA